MANQQEVEELLSKIKTTLAYNDHELVSRSEWGTINFQTAENDLDRVFSVMGHLQVLPLQFLTDDAVRAITQTLNELESPLKSINTFELEQGGDPKQKRDQFVSDLHGKSDNFYATASAWIPFLAYQNGEVLENINSLTGAVTQAKEMVVQAEQDITDKHEQIDTIVTKAREASAAAGAAIFTKDFSDESGDHMDSAKRWLYITAGLGVVTLCIVLAMLIWSNPVDNPYALFQQFGTKIALLAVLFTATLWSGRQYKARMHQSISIAR